MNRKTCIYRIFNSSIRSQTQLTRRAEALVLPRLGRATDGEVARSSQVARPCHSVAGSGRGSSCDM